MHDTRLCFVSPDGTDAFLLFETVLYRMPAGTERPYELLLDNETTDPSAGRFAFEDPKLETKGFLLYSATSCTVRSSYATGDTPYIIGEMPEDVGAFQPLSEFDFRQTPALLLRERDTNTFVYLSRSVHAPKGDEAHRFSRAHIVTVDAEGHPMGMRDYGKVTDVSSHFPHAPRELQVERSSHRLYLTSLSGMDTGSWNELPGALEAVPLNPYDIRHNKDGSLLMFAPNRQVPALAFQMDGSDQLLYFSANSSDTTQEPRHAWLIDLQNPAEPWIVDRGQVVGAGRNSDGFQLYCIGRFEQPFYMAADQRTATWSQATFTQADLSAYNIEHDPATGKVVRFTP